MYVPQSSTLRPWRCLCLSCDQCGDLICFDVVKRFTFRVLHGSAPPYLGPLVVRSLPGRRSLRSTGTNRLLVPPVKRSTVGGRAFQVAGPKLGTPCQRM